MIKTLKNIILTISCFASINVYAARVEIIVENNIELGTIIKKNSNGLCRLSPVALIGSACDALDSHYMGRITITGDRNSLITITGNTITKSGFTATPVFYLDGQITPIPTSIAITDASSGKKGGWWRGQVTLNIGVDIEITNHLLVEEYETLNFVIDADYL